MDIFGLRLYAPTKHILVRIYAPNKCILYPECACLLYPGMHQKIHSVRIYLKCTCKLYPAQKM